MKTKLLMVLLSTNLIAYADSGMDKKNNLEDQKTEVVNEKMQQTMSCKEITDNSERLKCYDENSNFAIEAKASDVAEPNSDKSNWLINNSVDPITDKTNYMLFNTASDDPDSSLAITCKNNETDLVISVKEYLDGETVKITTRIDKLEPIKSYWAVSVSGAIAFNQKPVPFIKNMFGGDKMVFQVSAYSKIKTVTFNISGLEEAIKDLRKECNW